MRLESTSPSLRQTSTTGYYVTGPNIPNNSIGKTTCRWIWSATSISTVWIPLCKRHTTARTTVRSTCCAALKNFILYAIRNEWIEKNPFRYYKMKVDRTNRLFPDTMETDWKQIGKTDKKLQTPSYKYSLRLNEEQNICFNECFARPY